MIVFGDTRLFEYMNILIIPSILVTLKMIFFSFVFSVFFGFLLGILMFITKPDGLKPNKIIFFLAEKFTDLIRSFPTLILMVAITPITKFFIGTSIGVNAAIFTITLACTPFAARMTLNSFNTIDKDLIKVAKSFGATNLQIIFKVLLVESLPTLISNYTIMLVNMLNMSAMAGAIGAGGLGAVALAYGYQQYDEMIMYFIVFILIIIVFLIEKISKIIYYKLK
ncbi:ABC transporter permease subunit [Campylobacter sp. RM12637]|nr:ABC transporter permease subunit [Campylobacter sp. RM12637]